MKRIGFVLALLATIVSASESAPDAATISDAKVAATTWLALIDTADYANSWQRAATFFRSAISVEGWAAAARDARAPFGALKSRQLKSATFTHTLPGAPPGDYVVIQYTSAFANKPTAVEVVTPLKEKDGSWHVSGYYIQ